MIAALYARKSILDTAAVVVRALVVLAGALAAFWWIGP